MLFQYDLNITDLLFRIESPKEIQLPAYFIPFAESCISKGTPDILIQVFFGTGDMDFNRYTRLDDHVFLSDDGIIRRYYWKNNEHIVMTEPIHGENVYRLDIPADFTDVFCANGNWLMYLAIERMLIRFRRVILHSSSVIYKNKAYLFTAPSGGGKSTHAELWERYYYAKILNGDKTVISADESGCQAYGSPVAGSSRIYCNDSAPIAAIVLLKKGANNYAALSSPKKAYLSLYSEMIKSTWDETYNRQLLTMTERILKQVPVLELECTPDRKAVDALLNSIERMIK